MKKSVLIIFLFILVLSPLVFSADGALGQELEKAEQLQEEIEKAQDVKYWEEKWDYLGGEWGKRFLKNPIVSFFDRIFTKASLVFQIFFGVPYSLSFVLLGVVIFWIFFLLNISRIVDATGLLSGGMAYLGGLLLCVVFAQFSIFEILVLLIGRILFSPAYMWTRTILWVVFIGSFVAFDVFDRRIAAFIRRKRMLAGKKSADTAQKSVTAFADALSEGASLGKK